MGGQDGQDVGLGWCPAVGRGVLGVVVWVVVGPAPPWALTGNPLLISPSEGEGWLLADPGTRCCGSGYFCGCGGGGGFRASPCSLRSRPPSQSEGGWGVLCFFLGSRVRGNDGGSRE